jgi:polar amino acid transport system substrate-binding protein
MGQKGNADATKIMDAFNKALATAVSDGTYKESYKKWFDSEPAVMPKVS